VVEPYPKTLADAIDQLYRQRSLAIEMGQAGLAYWKRLNVSWSSVVDQLLAT